MSRHGKLFGFVMLLGLVPLLGQECPAGIPGPVGPQGAQGQQGIQGLPGVDGSAQPRVLIEFLEADSIVNLSTSWQDLISHTISVPSNGKIHIVANTNVLKVENALGDVGQFGIATTSNTAPLSQVMKAKASTDSAGNNMEANIPVSVQYLHAVSQGLHTYYLVGQRTIATGTIEVRNEQISLTFIPD